MSAHICCNARERCHGPRTCPHTLPSHMSTHVTAHMCYNARKRCCCPYTPYVRTHVRAHVRTHVHTYVHTHVQTHVHAHVLQCSQALLTSIHMSADTFTNMFTHMSTHTSTHISTLIIYEHVRKHDLHTCPHAFKRLNHSSFPNWLNGLLPSPNGPSLSTATHASL